MMSLPSTLARKSAVRKDVLKRTGTHVQFAGISAVRDSSPREVHFLSSPTSSVERKSSGLVRLINPLNRASRSASLASSSEKHISFADEAVQKKESKKTSLSELIAHRRSIASRTSLTAFPSGGSSGSPSPSNSCRHSVMTSHTTLTNLTSISQRSPFDDRRSFSAGFSGQNFDECRRSLVDGASDVVTTTPMDFFHLASVESPNQPSEIQRLFKQGEAGKAGHQHGRKALMAALASGNDEVEESVRYETPSKLAAELAKKTEKKRCSALVTEGSFDVLKLMSLDHQASTRSNASPIASEQSPASSTSSQRARLAPWNNQAISGRAEVDREKKEKKISEGKASSQTGSSTSGSIQLLPVAPKTESVKQRGQEIKSNGTINGKRKGATRFCCRFMVPKEIAEASDFRAPSYLIGPRGQNMKKIFEETQSKLRVRGQRSGHKEGPEMKEADEPLQVCVSSETREQNERTKAMVMTLFDKMIFDFARARNRRRSEFKVDVINGQ